MPDCAIIQAEYRVFHVKHSCCPRQPSAAPYDHENRARPLEQWLLSSTLSWDVLDLGRGTSEPYVPAYFGVPFVDEGQAGALKTRFRPAAMDIGVKGFTGQQVAAWAKKGSCALRGITGRTKRPCGDPVGGTAKLSASCHCCILSEDVDSIGHPKTMNGTGQ